MNSMNSISVRASVSCGNSSEKFLLLENCNKHARAFLSGQAERNK